MDKSNSRMPMPGDKAQNVEQSKDSYSGEFKYSEKYVKPEGLKIGFSDLAKDSADLKRGFSVVGRPKSVGKGAEKNPLSSDEELTEIVE